MSERNGAVGVQEEILLERDGDVGWIRINRPERLNALSGDMRSQLDEALAELERDDQVRSVVVTGVGRAFCTGGDVQNMARLLQEEDAAGFRELVQAGAGVVRRIASMPKPVIAGVNGIAAGAGAALAIACDLRVASDGASIGFTFPRVGLHPDWGATYFLPRIVGASMAAQLLLTGEMMSAERAERVGIFHRVVTNGDFEDAVRSFAGEVAARPTSVLADIKRGLQRTLASSLEEMLEFETRAQVEAFGSPAAREGITAFLEKRAPRFGR